ncbi:EscU/YscU/HrcU family type III secretion system export apparatus switch protein [Syntrophomonas wolfei]|uniref:Flagellar biosynthesis n=1 Tax=Syntrophomonas wolfei subsp. wolfei (strain DSM 2245B / Goettingen) TaxID=335541 RepID=Q0AWX3_SYNWW|nr:EscU/YscU/HrcU family type III secretion system export apparatus switch protein [Syntrophomonas wolfei]ABI68781.1 flagellar biosynthesis [Syntrophomonas wolfei subsp. wolfei str. Goettingen G311]
MKEKDMEKAVALRYDMEKDEVPVVVAKGQGFIAEKIKKVARESGVPIKEDRELADYLMALDLYEEIPPELYAVVAEILAFIYRMDKRFI